MIGSSLTYERVISSYLYIQIPQFLFLIVDNRMTILLVVILISVPEANLILYADPLLYASMQSLPLWPYPWRGWDHRPVNFYSNDKPEQDTSDFASLFIKISRFIYFLFSLVLFIIFYFIECCSSCCTCQ